jgi:hypothetical protein
MSDDLKDILSNLNPDIDQETLLRYLQGTLSAEKQHEVEKKIMDHEFEADAVEGLEQFQDKKKIQDMVLQLNRDLKKKTEKKNKYKNARKAALDPWVILAIILVLVLVVISYFIIRRYLHQG